MKEGKSKIQHQCRVCGIEFETWRFRRNVKTCSKECSLTYQKTPEYREALRQKHLGKVISAETRAKISEAQKGKRTGTDNHLWKGDDVGYRAMHDWIRREKGLPRECEHCGSSKRRLVWANKSHEYRRDVDDWMRLCYPCHRKYDFPHEKHKTYN